LILPFSFGTPSLNLALLSLSWTNLYVATQLSEMIPVYVCNIPEDQRFSLEMIEYNVIMQYQSEIGLNLT